MPHIRRAATLLATLALALLIVAPSALAGPGQAPTPADCAAPPAGEACLVVSGVSDHPSFASQGEVVTYTFTLTNSGDTDDTDDPAASAIDIQSSADLDAASVRVDGATAAASGTADVTLSDPVTVPATASPRSRYRAPRSTSPPW